MLLADATVQVNLHSKVRGCDDGAVQLDDTLQEGWTALISASVGGHTTTVQVLLDDARVEINIKGMVGACCLIALCILIPDAGWEDCVGLGQGDAEG